MGEESLDGSAERSTREGFGSGAIAGSWAATFSARALTKRMMETSTPSARRSALEELVGLESST